VNPQPYDVDLDFERTARPLGKMFDDGFAAPIRQSTPVKDPLDATVVRFGCCFEMHKQMVDCSFQLVHSVHVFSSKQIG
jgi:hypothetical protein